MIRRGRLWICGLAVLAVSWGGATGDAETVRLRRVEFKDERFYRAITEPGQLLLRLTSSQSFSANGEKLEAFGGKDAPAFSAVIKKEPAKYASSHPFRFMAKLGSDYFGFVLDGEHPESKGFDRLYFDSNHNGDLTDDEVIHVRPPTWSLFGDMHEFPRVSVTVRVDGKPAEYSFFLMGSCSGTPGSPANWSAWAQLMPGNYYEGEFALEGKGHRIILQDFNSNGRFDDAWTVDSKTATPTPGDVLLIDPDLKDYSMPGFGLTDRKERHAMSKLVCIDGRFYDVQVSPTCDTLTLTPCKLPMGTATNPAERYQAVLYGERGMVKIRGEKSKAVQIPAGDWKLSSYTIEASTAGRKRVERAADKTDSTGSSGPGGAKTPSDKDKAAQQRPAYERMLRWVVEGGMTRASPFRPRVAMVSAQATKDCPTVKVPEGKTTSLPFGPPYKAVVDVSYVMGGDQVSLGMKLVGSAGETCTNLAVEGGKPDPPAFEIRTAKGEFIERGTFEYG
jgi:hypothetical protein